MLSPKHFILFGLLGGTLHATCSEAATPGQSVRIAAATHWDSALAFHQAAPSAIAPARREAAIARALQHIAQNLADIPHDEDSQFLAKDVIIDADGTEHVRFDRRYKGLRVIGGDLVVHTAAEGQLSGFNLAFHQNLLVDTQSLLDQEDIVQAARDQWLGQEEKIWRPELVIYARNQKAQLAYEVVIEGLLADGNPSELHAFVDAQSGKVLSKWEGIETIEGTGKGLFSGPVSLDTLKSGTSFQLKDQTRGNQATFNMKNSTSGAGTLFTDSDNAWGDGTLTDPATIGVDAQYGAAKTWDYYLTKHQRKGIRNNGVGAASRVHYGRRYNNAFWTDTCFCMTYGDGDPTNFNPFVALDVTGHEMSHGVTSATADLTYEGESGGLNEATSDIFGTLVEHYAQLANDKPDYLIGEQLFKASSGTEAIRFMYQPSLDGESPDCYRSDIGDLDVHYSSGVANHFFYLLAEGSQPKGGMASPTCDRSTVKGIGRDAAGAIWYRALTVYMTSESGYADARQATEKAATDLFKADSAEFKAVQAAWNAVSVK